MQNFTYWSAVVYNILVRSVTSDANDHLLFRFGDTCRLGRPEFALISGLSFLPTEVDHQSIEEIGPSSLIEHHDPATGVRSYGPFGMNVENIKIEDIEARLVDEENAEIVYKLGLVYLIDVVMYGRASKHYVSRFVFNLVDDTAQFLAYPWGIYFWDASLFEWNKRIELLKKPPGKKGKKKVPPKNTNKKSKKSTEDELEEDSIPTDDIHGLVPVLVAWGCESLPSDFAEKIAVHINNDVPRILRWTPVTSRIYLENMTDELIAMTGDVTRYLVPSDDEVLLLTANGLTEDDISTALNTYPVPVDAPSQPAPAPTIFLHTDGSDPLRSGQAIPNQSSDDGNESVYLRAVSEMRAEIKQLIGDVMVVVRETREHVDRHVNFIKEEIKRLKDEHLKDIRGLGGVAQQINILSNCMVTIRNAINQMQWEVMLIQWTNLHHLVMMVMRSKCTIPGKMSINITNTKKNGLTLTCFVMSRAMPSNCMMRQPILIYYLRAFRCFNDSWGTTTAATLKEATSSAAVGDVRDVRHDERPNHEDHNGDTSTVNEATSWADVGDVGQGKRHVREEHNCDVPLPKRKTTQKTNLNCQTNMSRRKVRKR